MFEKIIPFVLIAAFLIVVCKTLGLFDYSFVHPNLDRVLLTEVSWRVFGIICAVLAFKSSSKSYRIAACVLLILSSLQIPFLIKKLWFRSRFHCLEQERMVSVAKKAAVQKRYDEAEKTYRAILFKENSNYFKEEDDLRWDLGEILIKQEKYEEGISLYKAVIEKERASQSYLPTLARHCQNLASLLKRLRRLPESVEFYKEVLDLNRQTETTDSYFMVVCLKQLAAVLNKLNNRSEARVYDLEAEEIIQRHHWQYSSPNDD